MYLFLLRTIHNLYLINFFLAKGVDSTVFSTTSAQYRLRSGTVMRTTGRYVTLVLDISERLRGRKFEVMKKAAVEYVEGIVLTFRYLFFKVIRS